MKTSLIISDQIYKKAKKKASQEGKSLSEVISYWAELGQLAEKEKKTAVKSVFQPVSLGKLKVDLTSRDHWMEALDDRD